MGATMLLTADAGGNIMDQIVGVAAMSAMMSLTCTAMLAAGLIHRWLGVTGMRVGMGVSGIVAAVLAVQDTFDGIIQSGGFKG